MESAVILAAGESKGTWPFSGIRQKATMPVLNVPMVRRLAQHLVSLGIQEIAVVTGHRAEAVRACLGDLDQVRFVAQPAPGGPVDAALHGLNGIRGESVVLCCGDIVTPRETLAAAVETLDRGDAEALLVVAPCPEDAPHWTNVEVSADGLVAGVIGHENRSLPRFGGIAAARTDTLRRYLLRNPGIMTQVSIGAMPPVEGDVAHSFDLMRQDGMDVLALEAKEFLVDVDRPWQIVEANYAAGRYEVQNRKETYIAEGAQIDDGAYIAEGAKLWLGPGARIGKGCHINGAATLGAGARVENGAILGADVTIGAHTVVKDYCSVSGGAVIGANAIVSHCAEFTGVALDTVYLYHYCCVTGLLGLNVDIGAATVCGTLRFDDGVRTQRVKGHKEHPARFGDFTYIGDYTRTGVNVMFMPGVKVGYYSCVGAGAIVYEDVPERTLLLPNQEQVRKEWGPEKYGW